MNFYIFLINIASCKVVISGKQIGVQKLTNLSTALEKMQFGMIENGLKYKQQSKMVLRRKILLKEKIAALKAKKKVQKKVQHLPVHSLKSLKNQLGKSASQLCEACNRFPTMCSGFSSMYSNLCHV